MLLFLFFLFLMFLFCCYSCFTQSFCYRITLLICLFLLLLNIILLFIVADVDECAIIGGICPPRSTYCVNTIGSFLCNCSEGYERSDEGSCVGK